MFLGRKNLFELGNFSTTDSSWSSLMLINRAFLNLCKQNKVYFVMDIKSGDIQIKVANQYQECKLYDLLFHLDEDVQMCI